jgi:hypothetical protein
MTVRDVYIFEDRGQVASDFDCDDPEAEALDDIRYARRLRRAPLIRERSLRRVARERRASAITDRDIEARGIETRDIEDRRLEAREIEAREIEDEVDDTSGVETRLNRLAFGGFGMGQLGATLAVIGLLIMAAALTGPSWGWGGGGGYASQRSGAYGYGHGSRVLYADDVDYADEPDVRYGPSAFGSGPQPFVDPSRAMLAGGTLFLVGLALLATRRRRFLLP